MNFTVHISYQKYEQSYEEVYDWYVQRSVHVQQCTSFTSTCGMISDISVQALIHFIMMYALI